MQDNPLAGLVNLDLLLVVDNVLLVVIALALYVALRPTNPSVTTMATGLWLLAIAMLGRPSWPAGRAPPCRQAMSSGSSPGS